MNKTFFLLLAVFGFSAHTALAQNYIDIMRYSERFPQTTARSAGAANATGALGGDFSSANINPAGLGLFRYSAFGLSVGYARNTANTTYRGQETSDDKFNFNIPGIHFLFAIPKAEVDDDKLRWRFLNVGIGLSRTNNFHSITALEGENREHSITDSWAQQGYGIPESALLNLNDANLFSPLTLAYHTNLINATVDSAGVTSYYSEAQNDDRSIYNMYQEDIYTTRGAMNDIYLSIAGNYGDKLYVGGSLFFPTVSYKYNRTYTETNLLTADKIKGIRSLRWVEEVNTSGIGFSANLGAIYRLNDAIRLGAAFRLPTVYSLTDNYEYILTGNSVFGNGESTMESGPGQWKYTLTTPSRLTLSGAYIFDKLGFISIDYESINYTSGRLSGNDWPQARDENKRAERYLQQGHNLRLGTEWRYESFAFRGGLGFFTAPIKSEFVTGNYNARTQLYSLGAGYRESSFFLDLSWELYTSKDFILPYSLTFTDVPGGDIRQNRTNLMLTIGSRF